MVRKCLPDDLPALLSSLRTWMQQALPLAICKLLGFVLFFFQTNHFWMALLFLISFCLFNEQDAVIWFVCHSVEIVMVTFIWWLLSARPSPKHEYFLSIYKFIDSSGKSLRIGHCCYLLTHKWGNWGRQCWSITFAQGWEVEEQGFSPWQCDFRVDVLNCVSLPGA